MNFIDNSVLNRMSLMVTCLMLSNINGYVISNKLNKAAANGQSNIAYSQDNKGSYQFAYEVTDKGGASNFRQETGGPKAVKGSYGLTDADGRTRLVNYQADKYGFVATVDTNEPGTGREDSANVAYNGQDKGKGWAYALTINDNQNIKMNKNKFDGSSNFQSYNYADNNNFNENKFNSNQNNNEEQYSEKNYDRREEYKNPIELVKPTLIEKQQSIDVQVDKKNEQIKNVNYESGGHFDTSSAPIAGNTESDKNYDQLKTQQDDVPDDPKGTENSDDKSEEEPYEKRQMHLVGHPKPNKSDYLITIDKIASKDAQTSIQKSTIKKTAESTVNEKKIPIRFTSLHNNKSSDQKRRNEKLIK